MLCLSVKQPTQPAIFDGSSHCLVRGLFQLTASLFGSATECSGDLQSTAMFSDSTVQMNLCSQGTLRNSTFKTKTLLQDSLTCMAALDGSALNPNETGSTILLLRDSNVLYCARLKNLSGVLELSIEVKNTSYYAGCSFATPTSSVLRLVLSPFTSTPGLPTTTPTPTTLLPTTTLPTIASTTATTLPTTSTTTSTTTTTTTTTTTSPSAITIPTTTTTTTTSTAIPSTITISIVTPSITTQLAPGGSRSTPGSILTTRVTSKGPPENVEGPSDNCPTTACATGAVCNEATHTCRCQALFYAYNSSSCTQDDRAIDDTFLKIVVPIIAIAAGASLIAALVLCFVTRPLDTTLTVAALAAASADNVVTSVQPALQPATQLPQQPVFVSYGRNDTYANADAIDRSLVTYGSQPGAMSPVPQNNFVMVGSSIPAKM